MTGLHLKVPGRIPGGDELAEGHHVVRDPVERQEMGITVGGAVFGGGSLRHSLSGFHSVATTVVVAALAAAA